ncbi:hypothetical protein HPB52_010796 [Rhipicephalus sanguineus]|uniref:Uncharacterized protein n=1 Tax=Rhipicephalus sanguineus TaxID=34632 RepID=A0A9D4T257_RHISA|nr:hypothetical protein HPB52_010796 [Rhipicephalus sanguineus]
MSSAASRGPLMSSYYSDLIGSARIRYEEKVQMCDGIDPYTLRPHADTTTDVNTLPEVTHGDIVNYLVYSSSFATLQEMKAFKSLEAHNYFTSGWVKSLSTKRLQEGKVVLLGEINHSQRLGEHPLKVWVLCKADGIVLTAHCTCMSGVSLVSAGSRTEAPASPLRVPEARISGSNSAQDGGGLLRIARDDSFWPPRPPSRGDAAFASPSRAATGAQSVASPSALRVSQPGSIYVEIETESTSQGNESAPLLQGIEMRSDLPLRVIFVAFHAKTDSVWPRVGKSGSRSSSRSRRSRAARPPSSKLERNTASYWVLGLTIVCLVSASALLMTLMNRGYLGALANSTASPTTAHPRVLQTDEPLPGDPNFKAMHISMASG